MIFDYPDPRSQRRHGPRGYAKYHRYLPWLRDEFAFRCTFCLKREQWGQVTGEYEIDHFKPRRRNPRLATEYVNLEYVCRRCNSIKSDQNIGDAIDAITSGRFRIMPDGTVWGADKSAKRLILMLDLNSPRLIDWRITWTRIVELARQKDPWLWKRLVGFPVDLPDLRRLRPPLGNSRPEGIAESWAVLAERGELPDHY